MAQSVDSLYINRCLELAGRAEGYTSPNPMVAQWWYIMVRLSVRDFISGPGSLTLR